MDSVISFKTCGICSGYTRPVNQLPKSVMLLCTDSLMFEANRLAPDKVLVANLLVALLILLNQLLF